MAVNLSPIWGAGAQLLDNSGNVLSGGKIYTYAAGTTTPVTTFTSATGDTANSNPIVLNSAGRVPYEIWLTDGQNYKFVLKDSNDVLIGTWDNLSGINSNFIAYTNQQEIQTATAGQTVFNLTTMNYLPGTNSLSVFVDGVNQYGSGASYAYEETDSNTVTFTSGLHDGAEVKFTSSQIQNAGVADASQITYDPPFTNSVPTNVEAKLAQTISVKDFGAIGDGVTDDTAAIQAAIDSAVAHGQQITAYGTFKITAKIVIKGDTDFSQATFNVYDTPAIAVEVSTGNGANPTDILNNSVIWLPKRIENMTKPATGWAGQGIGVRTVNLYSCQVFVGNIVNFATGLQVTSYQQNNAYNNYYLGHLENNAVNLQLIPGDSAAATNENNFYGGRFSFYSAEGTNVSGTRQILISQATNGVNNNLFSKPSIEGNVPEYHVQCWGAYNTFLQARWEAATPKVNYAATTSSSEAMYNCIISGYNPQAIVFSYTGSSSAFNNQVFGASTNNYTEGSSTTGIIKYRNGGSSNPIFTFYDSSIQPETATSSQWNARFSSVNLLGKRVTDAYSRVFVDYQNGAIGFTDGTVSPLIQLQSSGSTTPLYIRNATSFAPYPDNTLSLGISGSRWTTVYATTGTINTSDENAKTNIRPLDNKEKAVALAIKAKIKAFKFKDAVEQKGNDARIHVGVIAQDVKEAFEAEGLDATRYGVFCSDILEDGTERLGIRYDELLMFIMGAI